MGHDVWTRAWLGVYSIGSLMRMIHADSLDKPLPSNARLGAAMTVPATSAPARASMLIFESAFFVLLPVAIFAVKGVAVVFVAATLAAAASCLIDRAPLARVSAVEWTLIVFAVFAGVSIIWSPRPGESFGTWIALAASLAGGFLLVRTAGALTRKNRHRVRRTALLGGAVGYTLLGLDLATGGSIVTFGLGLAGREVFAPEYRIFLKPAIAVAAILLWPWALIVAAEAKRPIALVAIVGATAVVLFYRSDSAILAVSAGAFAAVVTLALKERAGVVFSACVIFVIAAMPFVAHGLPDPTKPRSHLEFLPNSAIHRVDIWRNTAQVIAERPVLGHGLDSSRMIYGPSSARSLYFIPDAARGPIGVLSEPIPLHPHNSILQIWLETGLIGATLFAGVLAALFAKLLAPRLGTMERAAGAGYAISVLAFAGVSFGAWQSWWLAAIFLTAAALRLSLGRPHSP